MLILTSNCQEGMQNKVAFFYSCFYHTSMLCWVRDRYTVLYLKKYQIVDIHIYTFMKNKLIFIQN